SALSRGTQPALRYLIRTHGLLGGIRRARHGTSLLKRPFSGYATERFYSAAAFACGPYAVRLRLCAASDQRHPDASSDWAGDMRAHLARGPLEHDVQVQFYTDDASTPIEQGGVDWPETVAPYATVARLTIPQQDLDGEQASEFASKVEHAKFDPWNALME